MAVRHLQGAGWGSPLEGSPLSVRGQSCGVSTSSGAVYAFVRTVEVSSLDPNSNCDSDNHAPSQSSAATACVASQASMLMQACLPSLPATSV